MHARAVGAAEAEGEEEAGDGAARIEQLDVRTDLAAEDRRLLVLRACGVVLFKLNVHQPGCFQIPASRAK